MSQKFSPNDEIEYLFGDSKKSFQLENQSNYCVKDNEELGVTPGQLYLRRLSTIFQRNHEELRQGHLTLSISTSGVGYLHNKLQSVLSPRYSATGSIFEWRIKVQSEHSNEESIEKFDVFKLSVMIKDIKNVKLETVQDQIPSSFVCDISIFPSLCVIEFVNCSMAEIEGIQKFCKQLKVLRCDHCSEVSNLHSLLCCCKSSSNSCTLSHVDENTKSIKKGEERTWVALEKLKVRYSNLQEIESSLSLLSVVKQLDFSHNRISCLSDLSQCSSLKYLNLGFNRLSSLEGISTSLNHLTFILLRYNRITSLEGLEKLSALKYIDLSHNGLQSLREIVRICDLPHLKEIFLVGNPLSYTPDYRREILFIVSEDIQLDGSPWNPTELSSMVNSRHSVERRRRKAQGYNTRTLASNVLGVYPKTRKQLHSTSNRKKPQVAHIDEAQSHDSMNGTPIFISQSKKKEQPFLQVDKYYQDQVKEEKEEETEEDKRIDPYFSLQGKISNSLHQNDSLDMDFESRMSMWQQNLEEFNSSDFFIISSPRTAIHERFAVPAQFPVISFASWKDDLEGAATTPTKGISMNLLVDREKIVELPLSPNEKPISSEQCDCSPKEKPISFEQCDYSPKEKPISSEQCDYSVYRFANLISFAINKPTQEDLDTRMIHLVFFLNQVQEVIQSTTKETVPAKKDQEIEIEYQESKKVIYKINTSIVANFLDRIQFSLSFNDDGIHMFQCSECFALSHIVALKNSQVMSDFNCQVHRCVVCLSKNIRLASRQIMLSMYQGIAIDPQIFSLFPISSPHHQVGSASEQEHFDDVFVGFEWNDSIDQQ